jgi:hypothetical protein
MAQLSTATEVVAITPSMTVRLAISKTVIKMNPADPTNTKNTLKLTTTSMNKMVPKLARIATNTINNLGEFTSSYILHTRAFGTYLPCKKDYKVMVFYM